MPQAMRPLPHFQAAEDALSVLFMSLSQGKQYITRGDLKELGKQAKTHWSEQEVRMS